MERSTFLSTDLCVHTLEIPDVLIHIFKHCEPLQLCQCISLVCSAWKAVAQNKHLWHEHCGQLWKGKLYIIHAALHRRIPSPYDAFKISHIDAKRNVISYDELSSIQWHFRMKYRSRRHRWDSAQVNVARFERDYTLKIPQLGYFQWKFINDSLINKWRSYDDSATDAAATEYGWMRHDGHKSRSTSPFKRDRLKVKFQQFDKRKVANSIKSGMQSLRRKWKIKKNEETNPECNDDEDAYGDAENENEEADDVVHDEEEFVIKAPTGDLNDGRYIQVNQYPPLVVCRDANWGFILQNKWVTFTSY